MHNAPYAYPDRSASDVSNAAKGVQLLGLCERLRHLYGTFPDSFAEILSCLVVKAHAPCPMHTHTPGHMYHTCLTHGTHTVGVVVVVVSMWQWSL